MKIPQQPRLKICERIGVMTTDMCGRLGVGVWERTGLTAHQWARRSVQVQDALTSYPTNPWHECQRAGRGPVWLYKKNGMPGRLLKTRVSNDDTSALFHKLIFTVLAHALVMKITHKCKNFYFSPEARAPPGNHPRPPRGARPPG